MRAISAAGQDVVRHPLLASLVACALVACSGGAPEGPAFAGPAAAGLPPTAGTVAPAGTGAARRARGIAGLADGGTLLAYQAPLQPLRSDAGVAYPVQASEAHAYAATGVDGVIALPLPDGSVLPLRYERHVEHEDGNWTWFGRTPEGHDAVLTFGPTALYGDIYESPRRRLALTSRGGRVWLAVIDPTRERDGSTAPSARASDMVPAPDAGMLGPAAAAAAAEAAATGTPLVDVLLGYTAGFAAAHGGTSGALTRLQHLVAISNAGYSNSGIGGRLRLVGTLQVGYGDGGDNFTALQDLTGYTCSPECTPRTVPSTLQPLRTMRDTTGADLVSLVRDFRAPDHEGCGVAWLLGGDQGAFNTSLAPFGYSIVSDGEDHDEDEGLNYGCRVETLAHELGHLMGQTHNTEDADGDGVHGYSYGYREASSSGFYTIMAYRQQDSSQFAIPHFANPQISYSGRATGTAQADNARSMVQTMPTVAQFKAAVVAPPSSRADLFFFQRTHPNGTRIGTLAGARAYAGIGLLRDSALHQTGNGEQWVFRVGDYNRDGIPDVYALKRVGSGGKLEVHVLNGATGFSTFLLHIATPLNVGATARWSFDLGDYNGDGVLDLYSIDRMGNSGTTEVHVLNGANAFRNFLLNTRTALHPTGSDLAWKFALGDRNRDGRLDLYAFKRNGSNARTEIHILNGATRFQSWLLNVSTALHSTGTANDWEFGVADYDIDGTADAYAIKKRGNNGTEVHVLDGRNAYRSWLTNRRTALGQTGTDGAWMFDLAGP